MFFTEASANSVYNSTVLVLPQLKNTAWSSRLRSESQGDHERLKTTVWLEMWKRVLLLVPSTKQIKIRRHLTSVEVYVPIYFGQAVWRLDSSESNSTGSALETGSVFDITDGGTPNFDV